MTTRTPASRLDRDGAAALRRALDAVAVHATSGRRGEPDLTLRLPDGGTLAVEVKGVSIPTLERVKSLAQQSADTPVTVIVADQIPAPTRDALNDAGLSWLDRRGHLRLVAPGVFVDAGVPAIPRSRSGSAKREPIAGRSGLAAAAALLMRPDDPIGVSEIARLAGLNPSSITRALTSIADTHLAERLDRGRYRPLVPELFWALADAWPRDHVTIRWRTPPEHDRVLRLDEDLAVPGWAAAGVPGAVAWGAPLVATADYPIHLYAPDEQQVGDLTVRHADGEGAPAAISVDPIGLITAERYRVGASPWPVAHPLFCALDLTVSARDREALEQWTPPPEFTRVW